MLAYVGGCVLRINGVEWGQRVGADGRFAMHSSSESKSHPEKSAPCQPCCQIQPPLQLAFA